MLLTTLPFCSGFEEHPTLFWWVSGCATATSVCAATMLFAYSRVGPKMDDRRRAQVSFSVRLRTFSR